MAKLNRVFVVMNNQYWQYILVVNWQLFLILFTLLFSYLKYLTQISANAGACIIVTIPPNHHIRLLQMKVKLLEW
jgi:hypothetical protein